VSSKCGIDSVASRTPEAFLVSAVSSANVRDGVNFSKRSDLSKREVIRQVYGSVTVAGTQLNMFASAKTNNPEEAASLNDTLGGLKKLALWWSRS